MNYQTTKRPVQNNRRPQRRPGGRRPNGRRRKKVSLGTKLLVILLILLIVTAAVVATVIFLPGKSEQPLSPVEWHKAERDIAADTYSLPDSRSDPERAVSVRIDDNGTASAAGVTAAEAELISRYFVKYYTSLGRFVPEDTDALFASDALYERALCSALVYYLCGVRDIMSADLGYDDCEVGIKYLPVQYEAGMRRIDVVVNDSVNYDYIPNKTSYTCDVEHTFIIDSTGESPLIHSHSEISGAFSHLARAYEDFMAQSDFGEREMNDSQIEGIFLSISDELIDAAKVDIKNIEIEKAVYNKHPDRFKTEKTADNPYNAAAALEYSYEWAGETQKKRNPAYAEYDDFGGNCNNYTSQCLHAGGIPMDTTGSIAEQWKWYGSNIDPNGTSGRTMSWTGVEDFYTYCGVNSGFGLVTDVGGNIFSGRPGDILQYVYGDRGVHSVIITEVICDEEGNVVDYLINSNTTDKRDCPMMTYGYTDVRLIRVIGWNNG